MSLLSNVFSWSEIHLSSKYRVGLSTSLEACAALLWGFCDLYGLHRFLSWGLKQLSINCSKFHSWDRLGQGSAVQGLT